MEISKDYPSNLSKEELIKEIERYALKATSASGNKQYVLGPAYWREMSVLGQNELSLRLQKDLCYEINNLNSEISELKKNNRRSGRQTIILSIATILIAGVTLFIGYKTLDFSKSDRTSDYKWEEKKVLLLESLIKTNSEKNSRLDSIILINSQILSNSE